MDCIFCKIAAGSIPADIVFSDNDLIAFRDINPQAPVHVIIIPRNHIPAVNDLSEADQVLAGRMILAAKKVAQQEKIGISGYRISINCGPDGTQVVPHIHLHLLGGHMLTAELG